MKKKQLSFCLGQIELRGPLVFPGERRTRHRLNPTSALRAISSRRVAPADGIACVHGAECDLFVPV